MKRTHIMLCGLALIIGIAIVSIIVAGGFVVYHKGWGHAASIFIPSFVFTIIIVCSVPIGRKSLDEANGCATTEGPTLNGMYNDFRISQSHKHIS